MNYEAHFNTAMANLILLKKQINNNSDIPAIPKEIYDIQRSTVGEIEVTFCIAYPETSYPKLDWTKSGLHKIPSVTNPARKAKIRNQVIGPTKNLIKKM